jgi:CheY-like chemotaxis protein
MSEVYWVCSAARACWPANDSGPAERLSPSAAGRTEGANKLAASIGVLVDDLFFLAKIQETAKALGVAVVRIDVRGGCAAVTEANPQAIILDLNSRSVSAVEWIQALKADPATSAIRIVGFVSHVQQDLIAAAKAAGCDAVLARSAFTQQLPQLLRGLGMEIANPN